MASEMFFVNTPYEYNWEHLVNQNLSIISMNLAVSEASLSIPVAISFLYRFLMWLQEMNPPVKIILDSSDQSRITSSTYPEIAAM